MKFTVSSSALLQLLATTGKIISSKNTLPILDYFLLELQGDTLKATASDLETTFVGSIKVDSAEREGLIAAPAKLMLDTLKEFSEQPITIETGDGTWEIKLTWKTGEAAIPGTRAIRQCRRSTTSTIRSRSMPTLSKAASRRHSSPPPTTNCVP